LSLCFLYICRFIHDYYCTPFICSYQQTNRTKEVTDIPRFVKKSNWIPKPSKHTRLESVINLIKSDIKHNVDVHVPKTDNLTQAERSALRNIQERDDIIIKPADKGSAVVVMDKTTYLQEAERQLSDCRFYEKLDSDSTLDFTQKIMRALEEKKCIYVFEILNSTYQYI
jgi:tRNA/tmRNA/rRNA uracil-C5-methylase (TrmA/RlmC/RlmD family)